MPDFVDDNTDLPGPKTQITPVPAGEEDFNLSADEYNEVRQAMYDLRDAVQALQATPPTVFVGFGNGSDGALSFDGVTTPVAGATLAGGVYSLTRPIHATTISIANGVTVDPAGFPIHAQGAVTGSGSAKIAANGNPGSGTSAGNGHQTGTAAWYPAGGNGGAGVSGGGGANGVARASCIAVFTNSGGGGGLANASGTSGVSGKGGGGGGGASGIGGGGGPISFGSARANDWQTDTCWDRGRDLANSAYTTGSGGGAGGGATGPSVAGGGGGGSGGWIVLRVRSISGVTIEAKGGNGANAPNTNTGGGAGGSGGIVFVQYAEGSAPVPNVAGGTGGNGSGTGGGGGAGGLGVARVWKVLA